MTPVARFVLAVAATALGVAEAQAAADPQPTLNPNRIFSPNPPACAAEVFDDIAHFTDIGTGIVKLTTKCSMNGGWKERYYGHYQWHNKQSCAAALVDTIQQCADTASSTLALVFDCFNDNQACGQSIASVISNFLDVAASLVSASKTCTPRQPDEVIAGWKCWADTFKATQRIVASAKFIDVAISTCNIPDMGAPSPDAVVAGNVTDGSAGNSSDAVNLRTVAEALDVEDDYGAEWQRVGQDQPMPFTGSAENFQVRPVERRLKHEQQQEEPLMGQSYGALTRRLGAQLEDLRAFLETTAGVDRSGELPSSEIQV